MESLPLVEVASSSFDELIIFCLLFGFSPLNNVKKPISVIHQNRKPI